MIIRQIIIDNKFKKIIFQNLYYTEVLLLFDCPAQLGPG